MLFPLKRDVLKQTFSKATPSAFGFRAVIREYFEVIVQYVHKLVTDFTLSLKE